MPNLPVSMGVRWTHLEEFMPQCRQDISKMLTALLREQRNTSQATVVGGIHWPHTGPRQGELR